MRSLVLCYLTSFIIIYMLHFVFVICLLDSINIENVNVCMKPLLLLILPVYIKYH